MRIAQDRPHPGPEDWNLPSYVQNLIIRKGKELSKRTGFRRYERFDIEQDLLLTALGKRDAYDPQRGASPATFLARVVESRVCELIRERKRLKRRHANTSTSLEQPVDTGKGKPSTVGDGVCDDGHLNRSHAGTMARPRRTDDKVTVRDAITLAFEAFTPAQKKVAEYLIKGSSDLAISKQLGISRRQVSNTIEQIRQAMVDAGLDPRDANQ
jgi:RNA polymerase sigma factor (sigma-70 family)